MVGRQWQFEELRGEDGGSPILAEVEAETRAGDPLPCRRPRRRGRCGRGVRRRPGPSCRSRSPSRPRRRPCCPSAFGRRLGLQLLRLTRAAGCREPSCRRSRRRSSAEWAFGGEIDAESTRSAPPVAAARGAHPGRGTRAAGRRGPPRGRRRGAEPSRSRCGRPRRRRLQRGEAARGPHDVACLCERYVAAPVGTSWDPAAPRVRLRTAGDPIRRATSRCARTSTSAGRSTGTRSTPAAAPGLGAPAQPVAPEPVTKQVMPTPVRYPACRAIGCGPSRTRSVFLGGVKAGSTDLARLALVEFSLAFGTDWFLVPFPLPLRRRGQGARPLGGRHLREAAPGPAVARREPAGLDGLPEHAGRRRLAPRGRVRPARAGFGNPLEGPPLEEVALFRDEMANLVWGVERIVQGPSGEPVRRGLVESRSLRQQLPGRPRRRGDRLPADDARCPTTGSRSCRFRCRTCPSTQFATELERRPMVRFLDDGSVEIVHPHGVLLRATPDGRRRGRPTANRRGGGAA